MARQAGNKGKAFAWFIDQLGRLGFDAERGLVPKEKAWLRVMR